MKVVTDSNCPHKTLKPEKCTFSAGYCLNTINTATAYNILLTQESHVSLKMVPRHLFQIQPDEGLNCIIMGPRALVRTLSSISTSRRFCVDACSMIDSGVVNTICRCTEDERRVLGNKLCLLKESIVRASAFQQQDFKEVDPTMKSQADVEKIVGLMMC